MVRTLPISFKFTFCVLFTIFMYDASAGVIYSEDLFGEEYGSGFKLHWTTAKENNSQIFVIERSFDGLSFSAIGAIPASGNSIEELSYQFIDLELGIERAYYRLKQIDVDGTFSLSEPLLLSHINTAKFQIVSKEKNIENILYVNIVSIENGRVECTIRNAIGDVIFLEEQQIKRGLNEYAFNLEHENEGNYSVTFQKDNSIATHVFYKEADAIRKMDNTASKGWDKRKINE